MTAASNPSFQQAQTGWTGSPALHSGERACKAWSHVQQICSARLRAVCAALRASNGPKQAGQVARAWGSGPANRPRALLACTTLQNPTRSQRSRTGWTGTARCAWGSGPARRSRRTRCQSAWRTHPPTRSCLRRPPGMSAHAQTQKKLSRLCYGQGIHMVGDTMPPTGALVGMDARQSLQMTGLIVNVRELSLVLTAWAAMHPLDAMP